LRAIPVSNQERGTQLLLDQDVDAFVGVKSSILYQLHQKKLEDSYTIVSNYMLPIHRSRPPNRETVPLFPLRPLAGWLSIRCTASHTS